MSVRVAERTHIVAADFIVIGQRKTRILLHVSSVNAK
jgi:hypothetical protein